MTSSSLDVRTRRDIVYLALAGFFVTNAILGEVTGGKLFTLGPFTMSIGVIPWPVVFIATDLINEYFGREGVRRLTWMTIGLIAYAFVVLYCRCKSGCIIFAGDGFAVSGGFWPVALDHCRQHHGFCAESARRCRRFLVGPPQDRRQASLAARDGFDGRLSTDRQRSYHRHRFLVAG